MTVLYGFIPINDGLRVSHLMYFDQPSLIIDGIHHVVDQVQLP
ncbi:hypothetical protein [Moorena sp. SIOASIH]|nr:hypothetical protein [Moorena sp. SIOASIH]